VEELVLERWLSEFRCLSALLPSLCIRLMCHWRGGSREGAVCSTHGLEQVSSTSQLPPSTLPYTPSSGWAWPPSDTHSSASVLCTCFWWPPCPIPSSVVCSFTLREFYLQSINKAIIIRVWYSHTSSSVRKHCRQECGSFGISCSCVFLSQRLSHTV
jgi:hypothetical protein